MSKGMRNANQVNFITFETHFFSLSQFLPLDDISTLDRHCLLDALLVV